jgi:hypothetical protein
MSLKGGFDSNTCDLSAEVSFRGTHMNFEQALTSGFQPSVLWRNIPQSYDLG